MEPTFKPADHTDADLLLEMRREFCQHEDITMDEGRARVALVRLLGDPSLGRVWLIQTGGEPVGYLVLAFGYSLEFDGRDSYIDELYLRPPYRGRGLGQQALRFVEDVCATLDIQAVHLEVDRGNARALATYLKAGFEDRNNFLLTKRVAPLE